MKEKNCSITKPSNFLDPSWNKCQLNFAWPFKKTGLGTPERSFQYSLELALGKENKALNVVVRLGQLAIEASQ